MARTPTSVLDTIAKARWLATKKFPYLGRALFAATFIENDQVPTMAVDSRFRVYVNPAHIRECEAESFDAVITGVVHEILHPTLRHETRAKAARAVDHHRWNQCGDCELVQSIKAAGINIWSKDLTPEKMGWPLNLSAEEYYKQPQDNSGGGGGGKGQGMCSGGSGANGVPMPWELGTGPSAKPGPAGLNEAEADVLRAVVAQAIRAHAETRGRGSVHGSLLRWAESMLRPPAIDWKAMVGARVRYHIDTRTGPVASYTRPSRRQAGELVLPIYRSPRPKVRIVGDTSGSMGKDDIAKIIGVVYEAVEVLGRVEAIGCDAGASEPVEVNHIEELRAALSGGGGTHMTAGIERAAEGDPDAIVVVTDGDTDWPAEQPGSPVIVVLTRKTNYPVPAWAEIIDASDIGDDTDEEDDDS
jgi:predicted metal-dependent peptidase